jgi:hypothetical protein
METSLQMLEKSTRDAAYKATGENNWGERHAQAMANPTPGYERAIVNLLKGFAEYADAHKARWGGSPVGQDGFLGDHWEDLGTAISGLLNGETRRLDCGTIDSLIRKIGALNGAEGEDFETSQVSPAQRRAAIPDACSCPEDNCACKRTTEDGMVCAVCENKQHTYK